MKKIRLIALSLLLSGCSLLPHKNIAGTYQGTLTCADCEKIDATLVLEADNHYRYQTTYHFKNKAAKTFEEAGTYHWDNTRSDTIRLSHSVQLPLKVHSDNSLEFCDSHGNLVKGSANYKLHKTQ